MVGFAFKECGIDVIFAGRRHFSDFKVLLHYRWWYSCSESEERGSNIADGKVSKLSTRAPGSTRGLDILDFADLVGSSWDDARARRRVAVMVTKSESWPYLGRSYHAYTHISNMPNFKSPIIVNFIFHWSERRHAVGLMENQGIIDTVCIALPIFPYWAVYCETQWS